MGMNHHHARTGSPSPPPPLYIGPQSSSTPAWARADLSTLDKEKFFDELKQLYKKKVGPSLLPKNVLCN